MITIYAEEEEEVTEEESEEPYDNKDTEAPQAYENTAQLSVHAVQGTSSTTSTFILRVLVGKVGALALVDTGSEGN